MLQICRSRWAKLTLGTAAVAGTVLVGVTAAAGSTRPDVEPGPSQPTGIHTSARTCHGHRTLPALKAGDCVRVTAWGFVAGEQVTVKEYRVPGWSIHLLADRLGTVEYRYLVPTAARGGRDVLTFVGAGKPAPHTGAGNVVLSVPRIAVYRCRVLAR